MMSFSFMTFVAEGGRNSHEDAIRDKHKGRDYRGRSLCCHRRQTCFVPLLVLSRGHCNIWQCSGLTRRHRLQPRGRRGRGRLHAALAGRRHRP